MRTTRFCDADIVLGGVTGVNVEVPSANPVNYHHAITDSSGCERVDVDGKLFLPRGADVVPLVMVVPGSLGVADSHVGHARAILELGYGAFVLDPFGARAVESTVANQAQYSFAASAFDVLAAWRVLADHPRIDSSRVAAQGHSRGGSAVMTASMRVFADPIIGPGCGLAGTYAVYPWCGHQFATPNVGATKVRAIVGDQDEWVSVQQVQAQIHAITMAGGDASVRIVGGASHSFDRDEPVHDVPEASVAPTAPTVTLTDDGSMIDPWSGMVDTDLTDRDMFLAAVKGHGVRGAKIGSSGGQADAFGSDMATFHQSVFG